MSVKQIWLVVKSWPGGLQEFASAHATEESARYAASRLVGVDHALVGLRTVPLDERSITEILPEVRKDL